MFPYPSGDGLHIMDRKKGTFTRFPYNPKNPEIKDLCKELLGLKNPQILFLFLSLLPVHVLRAEVMIYHNHSAGNEQVDCHRIRRGDERD